METREILGFRTPQPASRYSGKERRVILAPEDKRYQCGQGVALAAENKEKISAAALMPVYLRLSQAERELKLKKKDKEN